MILNRKVIRKIAIALGDMNEQVVFVGGADFAHTTQHGAIKGKTQTKKAKYYNLDVIISVGYRVKSVRGTQFRQWSSQRLKDYLIKGYSVNQKRLEQTSQELQVLRSGIRILGRAIEDKSQAQDAEWLSQFEKGRNIIIPGNKKSCICRWE